MSDAYVCSFFAVVTDADSPERAVEVARELAVVSEWEVHPEEDAPEEKLAHDARYGDIYRRLCKLYGPLDAAIWLLMPNPQLNGDRPALRIGQGTPYGVSALIGMLESGAGA